MKYLFDIVCTRDRSVVAELNTYDEAYEYMTMMELNPTEYEIVKRTVYTVKGLGRDPDLH